jgi:hypothetical protein
MGSTDNFRGFTFRLTVKVGRVYFFSFNNDYKPALYMFPLLFP